MSLERCRERLPMPDLWARLGLGDFPTGSRKVAVPWRTDAHPSFSAAIAGGRWRWKDWGRDEGGDEVDLIKAVRNVATKDAIRLYHELAGIQQEQVDRPTSRPPRARRPKLEQVAHAEPEALDTPRPPTGPSKLVKVYQYMDAIGRVAHETLRFEPKSFRQRRPVRDGEVLPEGTHADAEGNVWTLAGADLVPYRLPELVKASKDEPVFLCEGEKDADNLAEVGLVATTLPMGTHKWRPEYAEWFAGRWVVVVEDFDKADQRGVRAGEKGAAAVVAQLVPIVRRCGLLRMAALRAHVTAPSDLSDFLDWALAETKQKPAMVRTYIMRSAQKADVAAEQFYGGVLERDESGRPTRVLQDDLAERLVRRERIMWSGGRWWQYADSGDEAGVWRPSRTGDEVGKAIADAVGAAGGRRLVSDGMVRSVEALAARRCSHSPDDLNQVDPLHLNLRNGMLDLVSGKLRPHSPDLLSTVRIPHRYRADAECPRFTSWLEQMQPSEPVRLMLQEAAGYILCGGINLHTFFFLFGDGGTGKSTFCDVLQHLVGDENSVAVQLQELDKPFIRHQLVGKQLYLCKELTKDSFKHIGLIKAITSGDPIFCDVKNKQGFTFRPTGRFLMESNVVAHTPDTSMGFERRFIQIDWRVAVPADQRDYGLLKKLIAESDGILRWAVEGFQRLHSRGRFDPTPESLAATEELLKHRDQIGSWAKSGWVQAASRERYCTLDELYRCWRSWCDLNDVKAFTDEQSAFAREVSRKRPEWKQMCRREVARDGIKERRWYGLSLSDEARSHLDF